MIIKDRKLHTLGVFALAVLVLNGACASVSELNSERIRRLYGSYGVEILAQNETLRVTNLYSRADDVTTCRTLAIVRFAPGAERHFPHAHAAIRAGASLGETLAKHGWQLEKQTRRLGAFRFADRPVVLERLMRIQDPSPLAVHVYDLHATRAEVAAPYARIVEVHHPAYWSEEALARSVAASPIAPLTAAESEHLDALINRVAKGDFD